ncbi:hypothetical protein ACHAXT_012339 [Thalassiosira profunda]
MAVRPTSTAALLLCRAALLASPLETRGAAPVPVPSTPRGDDGAGARTSSPPAGPLPDPPAGECPDSMGGMCQELQSRSSLPPAATPTIQASALPTGKTYCIYSTANARYYKFGTEDCFDDAPSLDGENEGAGGDGLVRPHLQPGDVAPMLWRDSGKIASQYALQVGLPPQLIDTLADYADELGVTDLLREYTSSAPMEEEGIFLRPGGIDENWLWYATGPPDDWENNFHSVCPGDERTHEEFLRELAKGDFDSVLDAMGEALGEDSLAVYQMAFVGGSYSEREPEDYVCTGTGGRAYNLIVPLLLEGDTAPELVIWDDGLDTDEDEGDASEHDTRSGKLRYRIGSGVLLGDDAVTGMHEFDNRNLTVANGKPTGMLLFASIWIAEITEDNAKAIARTLDQAFPLPSERWLLAQQARHWQKEGTDHVKNRLVGDKGRKVFRADDDARDCARRADDGECEDDVDMRAECPFSCRVYVEGGPTRVEKVDGDANKVNVCVQNRTGEDSCRVWDDNSSIGGDFVTPKLEQGELFPFVWRDSSTQVTPFAFLVGVPPELTTTLLEYCKGLGITDALRFLTLDDPLDPGENHFFELKDGNEWYSQRPPSKWTSNMHWISPADERTHEEYLKVLARGNFDVVLDAIGRYLDLESLAVYHLTFIGVSHSEKGFMHRDTHDTGASVYNVIIPLILEDSTPELAMLDDDDANKKGALKYSLGTAAMMGDDAMHGTEACDYRSTKGMRLAATVYIADINEVNAKRITEKTLTQIFPLADTKWLMAQSGRHWKGDEGHSQRTSLAEDKGRGPFEVRDLLLDCKKRAEEGLCKEEEARRKCLRSCGIYEVVEGDETTEDKLADYTPGQYIDAFFASLDEDASCTDESEECEELAKKGACMTDPNKMNKLGCRRSCLYCLTPASRDLFSLGKDQVLEKTEEDSSDDVDGENVEKEPPSPIDVARVTAKTERYFVDHILRDENVAKFRLSCQNANENCAVWAAEGECVSGAGWMGKDCPAACQNCAQVDLKVRCPIDESTNVFQSGDMNAMFERLLEEAGVDKSKLSSENVPTGGKHPLGPLTVIRSPYHDMTPYLDEGESEEDNSPLPWVVSIDDFLSDEECDKLIELGEAKGYKRSTEYRDTGNVDGSPEFVEAESRTSTNTFCNKKCAEDPIVKGVIERMAKLTGIPSPNYESLQLVKYQEGQFYQQHHDYTEIHLGYPYGPRILTIFFYLNAVASGGGTKFEELGFTVEPTRGTALIWPSVTNADLEALDEWTWHEALPVDKGVKFGANTWIHLRDFQNTPSYC